MESKITEEKKKEFKELSLKLEILREKLKSTQRPHTPYSQIDFFKEILDSDGILIKGIPFHFAIRAFKLGYPVRFSCHKEFVIFYKGDFMGEHGSVLCHITVSPDELMHKSYWCDVWICNNTFDSSELKKANGRLIGES